MRHHVVGIEPQRAPLIRGSGAANTAGATGGHSAGISAELRCFLPKLRLVGVDTIGSTIFGQRPRPRLMRGLGSSIYPRNVDYAAFDEVHWVSPADAVWACRALAASSYASGGWSVGAVGLVAGWLARTQPDGTRIVAIFPDGPQRYFDTVYSDDYCRSHNLLGRPPREPDLLVHPAHRDVDRWTRCATVLDPVIGGPRQATVAGCAAPSPGTARFPGRSSCCCSTSSRSTSASTCSCRTSPRTCRGTSGWRPGSSDWCSGCATSPSRACSCSGAASPTGTATSPSSSPVARCGRWGSGCSGWSTRYPP